MKNYERLYKKALERAREIHRNEDDKRKDMEFLFPELVESEDERIRKAIVNAIHDYAYKLEEKIPTEWLAWLEKQGEQKPINDTDEEIVEAVKDNSILDMIEPKFKVGDWVVNTIGVVNQIISANDYGDGFTLDDETYFSGSWVNDYHLWTIQDAKDGDVLVDVFGNIGIYQKHDAFDWRSYCSLGCNGGFRKFIVEHEIEGTSLATKEQRDFLYQKMHEAGYEWNAEKKELKKVEQKPVEWSEEDEDICSKIIETIIHVKDNRNGKPRAHYTDSLLDEFVDWLKSLKERIGG